MQAQTVINTALSIIGRLGIGRTAGPAESAVCLQTLNAMLLSWSSERFQIYNVGTASYTLVTGQASYQIGPTGTDFATARPIRIETAGILTTNASGELIRTDLKILNQSEWQQIKQKQAKSSLPDALYYDFAFPNGNLLLFPVPTFSGTSPKLELGTWTPLNTFATLTTDNTYPDGYERAIAYNLGVELAPLYQQPPNKVTLNDAVLAVAKDSLDKIRNLNRAVFPPMPEVPAP